MDGWMNNCLTEHELCRRREASSTFRPNRLLQLSPSGTFRLVSGGECPAASKYAALSYCWGKQPAESLLMLTRTTAQYLQQENRVESLPKTFREAIEIVQRYQVDYLWVDRLCIYQDSVDDWQREAATMKDVYQHAHFSIAALGASDSDGGCFFERDPSRVAPTMVRVKTAEDEVEAAYVSELDRSISWYYAFASEPLVQRSWVVQERLLAPRTLYFGSRQVFWECREARCAETDQSRISIGGADEDQRAKSTHESPCLWKTLLDGPDVSTGEDKVEQLFLDWIALVAYYTDRELTVHTDKLVAISGLAKDMRAALNRLKPGKHHRYLAGLWEEQFPDGLMWCVAGPAQRRDTYRAPTWSWASLDGRLSMQPLPEMGRILFAAVLSATMTFQSEDDTGEVESAALTLRGPFAAAIIDVGGTVEISHFDNVKAILRFRGRDGDMQPEDQAMKGYSWYDGTFDSMEDVAEEVFVLWIKLSAPPRNLMEGLLLADAANGNFRRIGIASSHFGSREEAVSFIGQFEERKVVLV
ncbi:heterokaryon incompatibility protein-domain-containing protein [Microdochium trichocladiopsis]|uniref:Heterokaryon incompatibility protein-domain-containing protein n=1 Tax=Microdochium trichocladiopsis TaxID=1682393 RepID=A0A9P8XYD8_9PEZI|nr:heterokaryon incompatibility protein-domain-containing protein [Microdochium trichocladiopsis]KAH7020828.1 heterokaryon incompatibility protein-domain-containing protein [Microdochium trichocladiopsis]